MGTITIENPDVEKDLRDLAASFGGNMDAALVSLLALKKRKDSLQQVLRGLPEIMPENAAVTEGNTRDSIYGRISEAP
jgi:hypothetical protein